MTELFLIAHKVRGEPAFDVAARMDCPLCKGEGGYIHDYGADTCEECNANGYWWIIPTSGHRAYPYNWAYYEFESLLPPCDGMPSNLPDHYPTRATAPAAAPSGLAMLLTRRKSLNIERRGR